MWRSLDGWKETERPRSRALDAICALGVAATGGDLVLIARLVEGKLAVSGRHGSLVEGWSAPGGMGGRIGEVLAGAGAVEALTLRRGEGATGMIVIARRQAGGSVRDRAVLHRLRELAQAQMAAEEVLEEVARAAIHRIEAVRA